MFVCFLSELSRLDKESFYIFTDKVKGLLFSTSLCFWLVVQGFLTSSEVRMAKWSKVPDSSEKPPLVLGSLVSVWRRGFKSSPDSQHFSHGKILTDLYSNSQNCDGPWFKHLNASNPESHPETLNPRFVGLNPTLCSHVHHLKVFLAFISTVPLNC